MHTQINLTVEPTGQRLDKSLHELLPDFSREQVIRLIKEGAFKVQNEQIALSPSLKVKRPLSFVLEIDAPKEVDIKAEKRDLDILFEDEHLLVLNKPAGLVVHPSPGHHSGTLVNALLGHCGKSLKGIGGERRPGIVHRLDKDTSGVLVVAKSDLSLKGLAEQFAQHSVQRKYQAIVWGVPFPKTNRIETQIGRSPYNRKKRDVLAVGGKTAVTNYELETSFLRVASVVSCFLETGRTHQIRVHMTSLGHPLIGDPLYQRARGKRIMALPEKVEEKIKRFPRQALHAQELGFIHPITKEELFFEAELPQDMMDLLAVLKTLTP